MDEPLAQRLRPRSLDDVVGQRHLLAPDAPFRRMIEQDALQSAVLYGPAGIGKTCIAQLIAQKTNATFLKLNATTLTVSDIRKFAAREAKRRVLYIDECYRLTRTQSDVLLPFIEDGTLIFLGASTENPFHSLSGPLVSRSLIFQLNPLTEKDLAALLIKGIRHYHTDRPQLSIDKDAAKHIITVSCGDGRKCLTLLEMAVAVCKNHHVDVELVKAISPNRYMVFEAKGDYHYHYASCMQGAIQASDPDSAIYWAMRWMESGEDIRYIARRILISAAEDAYGNPICTAVAHAAYTAAKEIGRPEFDIILSQAICLIATSKRDKRGAIAAWKALKDVKEGELVEIPKEMRDCHYAGAEQMGEGAYHDGKNQEAYVGINKKYFEKESPK